VTRRHVKATAELGPLERAIMDHIWEQVRPVTVRELLDGVGARRDLAYTTIMTVTDRLWRKGLLSRKKTGRAFAYAARMTREDYSAGLAKRVLSAVNDRQSILLGFVRSVDERDLVELERLVKKAQHERRSRRST
jgi:predicted transcriptional regulator